MKKHLFLLTACAIAMAGAQAQTSVPDDAASPRPSPTAPASAAASSAASAPANAGPTPTAPQTLTVRPSEAERDAVGRDLENRRSALDASYKNALRQCYQLFDVTNCRVRAREDYLRASKVLRQEELVYDAERRRIKTEEARQRLADKQAQARERAEDAQQAKHDAQERAQRNADKQAEHAATPSQRDAYTQKQRDAADHRDSVERRARERDKSRAAPLPPPSGAQP